MTKRGELVALGTAQKSSEEILNAENGIMVKTRRVIMERGVYPKMWK
jgi:archaeosine-15-forming tRNA-guanine transglycosylase